MDVWNSAKGAAYVAWDSIGGNFTTGAVWTVFDYIAATVVTPALSGLMPGGAIGGFASGYYNNMLTLTKLSLRQS